MELLLILLAVFGFGFGACSILVALVYMDILP